MAAKSAVGAGESQTPREKESFGEVGDHPVFRDETVSKSTGDHAPPFDRTAVAGKPWKEPL